MRITRKTTVLAGLVAAAVTLTACGSSNNSTASSSSSSSSSTAATDTSAPMSSSDTAGSSMMSSGDTSGMSGSSMMSGGSSMTSGSGMSGAPTAGATFDGSGFTCATGSLRSSGSTAQGSVIKAVITAYNSKCGASINAYGGGGSGKGVSDFIANQTDFGGSDSAFTKTQLTEAASKRCASNEAIDLPMVTGPIAIAYNLQGVDKLILTPKVIGLIFEGTITTWNDKQIADLNSGVTLPSTAITTVHRSEASGTTDNFTKYLLANDAWTGKGGKSWDLQGGQGAQGSDGVQKAISATTGSVGYLEYGYATSGNLPMAQVDNGGGPVALTADSAGKAVAAATVVGTGKDLALKLDYAAKTAGAYPLILVTNELVCSAGNGDKAALLKSFLGYMATDAQSTFVSLGAAPLPASVQSKVVDAVKALS